MNLSIIVPVYNTAKYIRKCINSLLDQDYDDYEIILIDDGSTDESGKICDEFAKLNNKIRVFHKQNNGVSSARNDGIKLSVGKYLLFVDADDWIEKDCLSFLMGHIVNNELDILRFNYIREYENKSLPKINRILEEKIYTGEKEVNEILYKLVGITGSDLAYPENFNFLASTWCNIFKKKIISENMVFFEDISNYGSFEDGLFNIMVHAHINCFEFVDKAFYHYRKTNNNSTTSNYRKVYLIRQIRLFEKIKEVLIEYNKFNENSFYNRIALSTMELCLNAIRNKNANIVGRYREIKQVLYHSKIHEALKKLYTKFMPFKWKIYYFCARHRLTTLIYLLTVAIQKLKERG